jgi:hypothetical protein
MLFVTPHPPVAARDLPALRREQSSLKKRTLSSFPESQAEPSLLHTHGRAFNRAKHANTPVAPREHNQAVGPLSQTRPYISDKSCGHVML